MLVKVCITLYLLNYDVLIVLNLFHLLKNFFFDSICIIIINKSIRLINKKYYKNCINIKDFN
jgi:hypothetical protein